MVNYIIAVLLITAVTLSGVWYLGRNSKQLVDAIKYEFTTYLLAGLLVFGLNYWGAISIDFWTNWGILFGAIVILWRLNNLINKSDFQIFEIIILVLIPFPFYFLYGLNFAFGILIGVYSPILAIYTVKLFEMLSKRIDFSKIKLPTKSKKETKK
jgi:hypothetical protein